MFISLKTLLKRAAGQAPPAATHEPAPLRSDSVDDEQAAICEELEMTEEMRETIFPPTTRMVSVIF